MASVKKGEVSVMKRHPVKLFTNGSSQAVRIPPMYRLDTSEIYLFQDPLTGDVILSRQPASWDDYCDAVEELDLSGTFRVINATTNKRLIKLSIEGQSQVINIPVEYRFDTDLAYIFQDPFSCDIIISRQPNSWDVFFNLIEQLDMPKDFMEHRAQGAHVKRDLFRCQKYNTC